MPVSILFLFLAFFQGEVPYKPSEDFHLGLDYNFKQRPSSEVIDLEREKHPSTGAMPYLIVNCKILKLAEGEVRMKIIRNLGTNVNSKKVKVGTIVRLDLGFTEDIKDRVGAHEYIIYFMSEEKKELSQIRLFIGEDGEFLVNGARRGKF